MFIGLLAALNPLIHQPVETPYANPALGWHIHAFGIKSETNTPILIRDTTSWRSERDCIAQLNEAVIPSIDESGEIIIKSVNGYRVKVQVFFCEVDGDET